jgi:hypothetical protein
MQPLNQMCISNNPHSPVSAESAKPVVDIFELENKLTIFDKLLTPTLLLISCFCRLLLGPGIKELLHFRDQRRG